MSEVKYQRFPILKELEKIFIAVNKNLYDNKLIVPDFIVMSDKKVNFKFDNKTYSIIVGSKFTQENYLINFLHEIIHVANYNANVCDTSNDQYHNKKFLNAALEMGFVVEFIENRGWEQLSFPVFPFNSFEKNDKKNNPTIFCAKRLLDTIEKIEINEDLISEAAIEVERISTSTNSRVYQIKYTCKCSAPYNSIRSGRRSDGENPLKIKCMICNALFVEEGLENESEN